VVPALLGAALFWLVAFVRVRLEQAWTDAFWDECVAACLHERSGGSDWGGLYNNPQRINPYTGETLYDCVMSVQRSVSWRW